MQDGRIYIERVNEPFLAASGSGDQFRAGIVRAIALGWIWRHESGTYVKFTISCLHATSMSSSFDRIALRSKKRKMQKSRH